jgi:hypothetical protein
VDGGNYRVGLREFVNDRDRGWSAGGRGRGCDRLCTLNRCFLGRDLKYREFYMSIDWLRRTRLDNLIIVVVAVHTVRDLRCNLWSGFDGLEL